MFNNNKKKKLYCIWKFKHDKHFTNILVALEEETKNYNSSYIFALMQCFKLLWKWYSKESIFNRKLRGGHFAFIAFSTIVLLVFIIWLSVLIKNDIENGGDFFFVKHVWKRETYLKGSISTSSHFKTIIFTWFFSLRRMILCNTFL